MTSLPHQINELKAKMASDGIKPPFKIIISQKTAEKHGVYNNAIIEGCRIEIGHTLTKRITNE